MGRIGSDNSCSMKGTKRYIKNMLMLFLKKNSHSDQVVHFGSKTCFYFTYEGVHFQVKIREGVKNKGVKEFIFL